MADSAPTPNAVPRGGTLRALAAAAAFGVTAPVARRLAARIPPLALAGLLYGGAGVGLALASRLLRGRARAAEPGLRRADLPTMAAMVLVGGVIAPVLFVLGIARAPGAAGALALALELPFTASLAVVFFGDSLGVREWIGIAVVGVGAAALGAFGASGSSGALGVLLLAGACFGWALDSNLSQRLAARDPIVVARTKNLAAAIVTLLVSRVVGERLPSGAALTLGALATGFVGYGLSLVLYLRSLRDLGTARTGALFATAPFLGALASVPVLGEVPPAGALLAGAVMAAGLVLLLGSRHEHVHTHEALEHEHLHVHDEHHRHEHAPGDPPGEPHTHKHRHEPTTHSHPHVPDLHHRHDHD